ncbi:LOW QUALITY PROTEIN: protein disulfide-isomerase A6 homolog, partial [Paramacrobiotus metropolitanus]|uniref:LOW QUALITY PROTEIN: protein disulfide-isomerase A6 homolog n=1 Tax=Paramacrobiotus metropolitanus TaxID=2943436 RepID=UPI002445ECA6
NGVGVTFVVEFDFCNFSYNSVFALYDDPGDVVILTHENFSEKVLDSSDVWFVEFYAPWCSHCQKLAPEYKKAATEMKGAVHFGVVNCDDQKTLAEQFSISGYPTIKIFGRDKKAPTEYQSMRTMEALRKAALTALNELMEGSKVAKKREPRVIMDTPEEETGKQVSDQEPKGRTSGEETGAVQQGKDSETKPGESDKQGGSENAKPAKPTESDKANKIKPSKAAKKSADTENVPSILEYVEHEDEKVDQKGQSADKKSKRDKENTEKRKAEVDDREMPRGKERKQEEPSIDKPETEAGDKEGEDPKPSETKPKKRSQEDSDPEEGREKKKVTKAENEDKPADTTDDTEADDSLNEATQETEGTAESAKKQKTTETPSSDTEEDASGEPYAESPSGDLSVITLTDENFNSTVVSSEEPWLVEFYAPWCQYCRKFAPVYETIAKNLQGQVNVGAYDCDAEEVIANVYSIGNFPTLKLFPPGSKDLSDVITYDLSDMTAEDVQKWVNLQLSQLIPAPAFLS